MPTLPDTQRISQSPIRFFQISWIIASLGIFSTKDEKSSEFYLQIKKNIAFLVKDGCIVVKFYSIFVYMCPSQTESPQIEKIRWWGGGT